MVFEKNNLYLNSLGVFMSESDNNVANFHFSSC